MGCGVCPLVLFEGFQNFGFLENYIKYEWFTEAFWVGGGSGWPRPGPGLKQKNKLRLAFYSAAMHRKQSDPSRVGGRRGPNVSIVCCFRFVFHVLRFALFAVKRNRREGIPLPLPPKTHIKNGLIHRQVETVKLSKRWLLQRSKPGPQD
jgi:hypothetical protein